MLGTRSGDSDAMLVSMPLTAKAQVFRRARQSREALVNVAIAAATLGISVVFGSVALFSHGGTGIQGSGPVGIDGIGAFLIICSSLPLVARRRFPLGVFLATAAASSLFAGVGYSFGFPFGIPPGPTVALYLLASSRSRGNPWTRQITFFVVGFFIAHLGAMAISREAFPLNEFSHVALAWATAWFAGERTRLRREQIAELKQRVLGAEREAEREGRLAVAEERARIARDLHDSAGHAINVIVVRAGAARLRHDEDPERSRAALEMIEAVARQTATEIDQIVGALRDPDTNETVESPHGLASLDTLVAHHTAAGLEVKVGSSGTQRELNVTVDQAAFRILQEALTNASRHGAGTAKIDIAYGERELEITVANPVDPPAATRRSGGHGLIGMRERARLAGGSFEDECVNDNFRIHARLSYSGPRP